MSPSTECTCCPDPEDHDRILTLRKLLHGNFGASIESHVYDILANLAGVRR